MNLNNTNAAVTVINPAAITAEASTQENIKADLSKLDIAGREVNLAVSELKKYEVITTKNDQDDAMVLMKLSKDVENAIEKKRVELVKPFNDSVKSINSYAKDLTGKLSKAIDAVKAACLKFQKEEEAKAKQARTTARQGTLAQLAFNYDGAANKYIRDGIGSMTMNEVENYDDNSFNHIISSFTDSIRRASQQQVAQLQEEKEMLEMFGNENDLQSINEQIATADVAPVIQMPVNGYKAPEALKGTTKRWTFNIEDINLIPREYLVVDETAIRKAIGAGVREIPGIIIFQSESLTIR